MDKISQLLTRRVQQILPSKPGLEKLLRSGRKIRLYQGFDPTGSRLHLGHTIGLRLLQEFADLGHEVIVLFGTGTVLVGDPSQRDTSRKLITETEIKHHIKTWKNQVKKIIDLNQVKIVENGAWLTKLTLKDIIHLGSQISAVQLFKRDSFQRRLARGDTVWYHETMYPLLQGYDSVYLDVDLEIGGTDQTFNMLIGRELLQKLKHKEKYVLTLPMIMGADGQPMSKTSGNCIWLNDGADEMYGKAMSIADEQIQLYLRLLTDIPLAQIDHLPDDPLNNKKQLALTITKQFHGQSKALEAQARFEATIQKQQLPDTIPLFKTPVQPGQYSLINLCLFAGATTSRSQIKRLIQQGGVEWNQKKITDPQAKIAVKPGDVLRFGKRRFFQVA